MMEMIARVTADYLNMQVDAGADVVQLFDSWVGSLGPDDYRRFVLPHTRNVIAAVRPAVPVIHFGTVTGNLLELMREAGGDVIGLDWRVDLAEAWERLGDGRCGAGQSRSDRAVRRRFPKFGGAHARFSTAPADAPAISSISATAFFRETPVDHVIALVDAVHEMSRR